MIYTYPYSILYTHYAYILCYIHIHCVVYTLNYVVYTPRLRIMLYTYVIYISLVVAHTRIYLHSGGEGKRSLRTL